MNYIVNKLDWDSNFFKIKVGELIINSNEDNIITHPQNNFDLIVTKQTQDNDFSLKNYNINFKEVKYVFSKKLDDKKLTTKTNILNTDKDTLDAENLFDLAFESGKFSRFKLDTNFTENQFKTLYKKWVTNSLNKQFADKIFYIKHKDQVVGFVTLKKHEKFAQIGLIAVSNKEQGKGLGSKLLDCVEQYCISNNLTELKIPTQKKNTLACSFYLKNKYLISEKTVIKHFWKK